MDLISYLVTLWAMARILSLLPIFLYRNRKSPGQCPGLSVVICGRNALSHWQNNLPRWLNQENLKVPVEFVLVNDASTDQSLSYLQKMAAADSRIRLVHIKEKTGLGKRKALWEGMQAARHKQLYLSDADCRPATSHSLADLLSYFGAKPSLFLGYGAYKRKGDLCSSLVFADAWIIARQYLSLAYVGIGSMAVGRNMACPKTEGMEALQKSHKQGLQSGDDDLSLFYLWKTVATKAWSVAPSTQTLSEAPAGLLDWATQKRRHWTTAPYYPPQIKGLHLAYLLLGLLAYPAALWAILELLAPLAAIMTLAAWLCHAGAAMVWSLRSGNAKQAYWLIAADLIYIFVHPMLWITQRIGRGKTWD